MTGADGAPGRREWVLDLPEVNVAVFAFLLNFVWEVWQVPFYRDMPAAPHWQATLVHLAWLQATVAMFGSLYFSQIMRLPPCALCWHQRIAMYPLVAILAVGLHEP